MATEKDLELLDSYLSNELEGPERIDFEKRLESDASLKGEYKLQKELIEGIRQARVAELKAMLGQTVIPPSSAGSVVAKISLWVLATCVIGGGLYYFLGRDEQPGAEDPAITMEQPAETMQEEAQRELPAEEQPEPAAEDDIVTKKSAPEQKQNEPEQVEKDDPAATSPQPRSEVKQPNLTPYDPTEELDNNREKPEPVKDGRSSVKVTESSIPVEVEEGNKKFNFHYLFKDGKLFLYGSFEKELYEILEFFNDNNKRTVFLYYNANYYLLDETQTKPAPLKAITDSALLLKLREYRDK